MEKKRSIKRKTLVVPKDRAEMEQFVSRIREAEEKINSIGAEATKEIAKWTARIESIKKNASTQAKPLEDEINEWAKGVFIFASGHQMELTDEGKKRTIEFATGDKIRWYFTPPSVAVEDEGAAIAELERRDLVEFIRIKKEINKEAILQMPEKIKNLKYLSVSQVEIFAIILAAMGIELQKGERKFKKVKI